MKEIAEYLKWEKRGVALYDGDCVEVMRKIPDNSVDLIVTDPPYFQVKKEAWDNQWAGADEFVEWLGVLCEQWRRVLKPNGSLYCFASPQMRARVEIEVGRWFNIMPTVTWVKHNSIHLRVDRTARRSYFPQTEAIIFAEHHSADNIAKGEAGYQAKCDELRGFVFEPLRAYIVGEFKRAGMLNTAGKIAANVACGFSASAGGMASRHYFSRSQWCLPTEEHYKALRKLLNENSGDYLRKEYDYLRKEYEDLRRPFNIEPDTPFTDVWNFLTVGFYVGKHPCEKPIDMMDHIIKTSSREGALVLDCFVGSGVAGESCFNLGREFIGIDLELKHSIKRLTEATSNSLWDATA